MVNIPAPVLPWLAVPRHSLYTLVHISRLTVLEQQLLQPDADFALGQHCVLQLAAGVTVHLGQQESHGKVDNLSSAEHAGPVAAAVLTVEEHEAQGDHHARPLCQREDGHHRLGLGTRPLTLLCRP